MPRSNRVSPFGDIIATPERGLVMGNRGLLHDEDGRIVRPWRLERWILCLLRFKGRRRTVMAPGRYTELFFLDEATGLAAGHRPCAECQRPRFLEFRNAWAKGNEAVCEAAPPSAPVLDAHLHAERITSEGLKRTFRARLVELPDGVFVMLDGEPGEVFLVRHNHLLTWSPGGYRRGRKRLRGGDVSVVTPASTVEAIRSGYDPEVHPSAAS